VKRERAVEVREADRLRVENLDESCSLVGDGAGITRRTVYGK